MFREHSSFVVCMCMIFRFQILNKHFSMFRDKPAVDLVVLHGFFPRPSVPNRAIWHALPNLLKRGLQNLAACAMIRPTARERRMQAQHTPADDIALPASAGRHKEVNEYDEHPQFPRRFGRFDRQHAAVQLRTDGAADDGAVCRLLCLNA